jgi:hypothetical protein
VSLVHISLSPSLGLNIHSIDRSSDDITETAEWLATVQSRFGYEGEPFQFNSSLYLRYGQLHSRGELPLKVQDNLILTFVPSYTVISSINLRLFLETTGETQIAKGIVDDRESNFIDPLFLYQTLFLGQKYMRTLEDGNFQFVYGIGYAFQQTVTKNFVLEQNKDFVIAPDNPLSNVQDEVTLESGYSAVVEVIYEDSFTEDLTFTSSIKAVAFTKKPKIEDIGNARASALIVAGLQFSIFNLDYNMRLLYDRNYSLRRQIDQAITFGIKLNI